MPASPVAVQRRKDSARRAARIVLFGLALVLGVVVALAVLLSFSGRWGVPYVPFTTERGSSCVNTWTGFRCDALDLADVDYFGGVEMPATTRVVTATYRSTHDYALDATLEVPAAASAAALAELRDNFGACDAGGHPSPLDAQGLAGLCVMANDNDVAESGVPDSRIFVVATGVRKDQVRVVSLSVRSR